MLRFSHILCLNISVCCTSFKLTKLSVGKFLNKSFYRARISHTSIGGLLWSKIPMKQHASFRFNPKLSLHNFLNERRVFWHIFYPKITGRVLWKKHVGEYPKTYPALPCSRFYDRSGKYLIYIYIYIYIYIGRVRVTNYVTSSLPNGSSDRETDFTIGFVMVQGWFLS